MYLSLLSLAWTLASSRPLLRSLPLNETEEKQSTADQEDSMPREEESTPEQEESTPEQEESTWLGTLLLTIAQIFAIGKSPVSITTSMLNQMTLTSRPVHPFERDGIGGSENSRRPRSRPLPDDLGKENGCARRPVRREATQIRESSNEAVLSGTARSHLRVRLLSQ